MHTLHSSDAMYSFIKQQNVYLGLFFSKWTPLPLGMHAFFFGSSKSPDLNICGAQLLLKHHVQKIKNQHTPPF